MEEWKLGALLPSFLIQCESFILSLCTAVSLPTLPAKEISSPFPSVVDCKTGHKFSLSQYAYPYTMWLCSSCQKVVFFSTPWMWASFATCFTQWDSSKCDASTYLKSAWACQFALSSSSWNLKPSCKHANKPELACQTEEGTCPVTAIAPTPKDRHLADWQLTSGAWVSPAGPSIWAQPRLQAPEVGTNEMAMALFKPPNLGCLFHRMSWLIYLPSFFPSSSFFLFLSIYPIFPPCLFFLFFLLQELQVPIEGPTGYMTLAWASSKSKPAPFSSNPLPLQPS